MVIERGPAKGKDSRFWRSINWQASRQYSSSLGHSRLSWRNIVVGVGMLCDVGEGLFQRCDANSKVRGTI